MPDTQYLSPITLDTSQLLNIVRRCERKLIDGCASATDIDLYAVCQLELGARLFSSAPDPRD